MSQYPRPSDHIRAFFKLTQSLADRFERKRTWGPRSVMLWLMVVTMPDRKMGYRKSLRAMSWHGRRLFGWAKVPSLASISMARRKVEAESLRAILYELVGRCEAIMGAVKTPFARRRFIAFDGTRVVMPRSGDTARKMARPKGPSGEPVHNPQGLLVMAVDVFRRLPLDWSLTGKGSSERSAMHTLVERMPFQTGDVAVMDRGFPSRALFAALIERGVDIVARMTVSKAVSWRELKPFLASNSKSAEVDIELPGNAIKRLRVRLVERDRKPGRPNKGTRKERMVILTTLPHDEGFDRAALIKIYGARWGIESLFGEMKSFMQVEDFHARTVQGCEQELVAAMVWMALGSFLQAEAERTLEGRRVVRADCFRYATDALASILDGRPVWVRLEEDIAALRQFSYTPQPNRHHPRGCKRPFGRSIQRGGGAK